MSSADHIDAFIAHSSEDKEIVEQIVGYICRRYNITVWYAPAEKDNVEFFISEIERGIQQTSVGVIFYSRSARKSHWVRQEYEMMEIRKKRQESYRIIPVLLPGIDDSEIDLSLAIRDYIDLRKVNLDDVSEFHRVATDLARKIKPECAPRRDIGRIEIPFVVLAMTASEAEELLQNEGLPNRDILIELVSLLKQYYQINLIDLYGLEREDWRPAIAGGRKAIKEIISEVTAKLNETDKWAQSPFSPEFMSYDFTDKERRFQTWEGLACRGGMLIADSTSMLHPRLYECLVQSGLWNNERISMMVIHPFNPESISPLNRKIAAFLDKELPVAFRRFKVHFDTFCEMEITSELALKRFIFAALPQVAEVIRRPQANPYQRQQMRERFGNPKGVHEIIWRGSY